MASRSNAISIGHFHLETALVRAMIPTGEVAGAGDAPATPKLALAHLTERLGKSKTSGLGSPVVATQASPPFGSGLTGCAGSYRPSRWSPTNRSLAELPCIPKSPKT